MSDRVPEDMPDRMPEDLPDRMPEDMPDHMPEDMPDRMPNRMSEDMSDRMPEDLPVRKCINVMVGITRSKVFFFSLFIFLCCFPFCFPVVLPYCIPRCTTPSLGRSPRACLSANACAINARVGGKAERLAGGLRPGSPRSSASSQPETTTGC